MTLHFWANVAAILCLIELLALVLPLAVAFWFARKGVRALSSRAHSYAPVAQGYVSEARQTVAAFSEAVVEPAINVKAEAAGARTTLKALLGRERSTGG